MCSAWLSEARGSACQGGSCAAAFVRRNDRTDQEAIGTRRRASCRSLLWRRDQLPLLPEQQPRRPDPSQGAECEAPGASVAKVAMTHGINANIVHGWRKLALEHAISPAATTAFVALAIESTSLPERRIDVELRRGAVSMR